MRKVSLILPDLRGGGAERVSLILAQEFIDRGLQVSLVLMRKQGELLSYVPSGARIIELSVNRIRQVPFIFAQYLGREQPDAAITNMWPLTSMCVLGRTLAGSRCRLAVVEHSTLSLAYKYKGYAHMAALRTSLALTYRLADVRVCVSSGVANDVAALSGINRDRIAVVYNPIPAVVEHGAMETAESLWGDRISRRIISVGNLKRPKNQTLLIRAFARLSRKINARLMLIGDGALRASLMQVACEEGVESRLVMPGFLPDPGPFYKSADLFVLSSDFEGFPLVVVEALSYGLPVVSTDCWSGPAEILENGRYGKLVPPGDEEALASAMAESLTVEHDREALKRRAAKFSPKVASDKYMQLLFP